MPIKKIHKIEFKQCINFTKDKTKDNSLSFVNNIKKVL